MFLILFVSRYLPISAPPFSIDTVLTFSINSPVPIWSSDYMYMLITDPLTSNGVRGIFEHFVLSPSREHDYSAVRSGVGLGNKVKMDIWHHSYVQPQVVSPMLWESYPMLHYGSIFIDGPIVLFLNHFCNHQKKREKNTTISLKRVLHQSSYFRAAWTNMVWFRLCNG